MESVQVGETGTQGTQNVEIGAHTAKVATSVLLGKVIVFVLAGISFIVVARLLGPSTYGIYILAMAIVGIFGSVGDLGIGTSFNKFIPEYLGRKEHNEIRGLLINGYALLVLFGGTLTLVTFLLSGVFAAYVFHNLADTGLIEMASFLIIMSILYTDSYDALIGFGTGKGIAITAAVEASFQSGVSIALALLGFGAAAPILGLAAGYGFGILVAVLLIDRFVSKSKEPRLSMKNSRKLLLFSLPIGISNILNTVVSNISLVVLGLIVTSVVVGNFGVASKVGSLIDLTTGSISVSLIVMYSTALSLNKSREEISKFYNYSIYLAFVLVAPLLFFLGVLATPFSYTAFGGVYRLAPVYISIMAFGTLLGLFQTYSYNLMISAKKVGKVLKYSAVTVAVQFALLPPLILAFKGVGLAVLLFVVAPIVGNVLYANGIVKVLRVRIVLGKVFRVLLANTISFVIVGVAALLLGSRFIPLLILSALIVLVTYPPMLSVVGALEKRDVDVIRKTTGGVPVIGAVVDRLVGYAAVFIRE